MQWKYNSTYEPAIFLLMACAFPEYFLGSKWPPNKYLGMMVNAIDKLFFFYQNTPRTIQEWVYYLRMPIFWIYLLKVKSHYMWNILHVSHNLCPIRKVFIRNSKCFTVGIISWAIFPQCDMPSHARNHLCRLWKESIKSCTCFSADTKIIAIF